MADETNTVEGEAAATASSAAAPKKQRAPRRAKAALNSGAAEATASPAKAAKERKKRAPKAAVSVAKTDKPVAVSGRKPRADAKPVKEASATAPASAADEMADLLQLEEENKRLRRTLAEKLRAENADLRKRLGLA